MRWPSAPLEEVLNPVRRKQEVDPVEEYGLLGVRLGGAGPFLRETKLGSEISAKKLYEVRAGDFIYSRLFAWRGAFGLIAESLDRRYVSGEFLTYHPGPDRIDLRFLKYWFRLTSVLRRVEADCKGSTPLTRNRFKEEFFLALEVPLPPIEEQRRIVAKIERLAAKLEEVQQLTARLDSTVASLLGNVVATRFVEGESRGWRAAKLGDVVIDTRYGTSEKTHDEPLGCPILRMGNIQNGRIETGDLKYFDIPEQDLEKWAVQRGDILVNRTNSAELVGKCAVFDLPGVYGYASYLIRLRLDTARANPWLVARYINSPLGRDYMFRERKQMTGQANVNATKIKALPICLPSRDEQDRVAVALDRIEEEVNAVRVSQSRRNSSTEALLPSILDKAFKGEL